MRGSLEHLWNASMLFGRYLEHAESRGQSPGCEPISDHGVIPLRPADPFEESSAAADTSD